MVSHSAEDVARPVAWLIWGQEDKDLCTKQNLLISAMLKKMMKMMLLIRRRMVFVDVCGDNGADGHYYYRD